MRDELLLACKNGDTDAVIDLISKGVDVNGIASITPLMEAVFYNHKDIAELLILNGANLEAKTEYFYTVLFHAVDTQNIVIAKFLIDSGADINSQGLHKGSFLTRAIRTSGSITMSLMLIENGIDIEIIDFEGNTALNIAATFGDTRIVEALIKRNAKLDNQDSNGMTAIMKSFELRYYDLCLILLEKSPDLTLKNNLGETVLDIAIKNKDFFSSILLKHDLLNNKQGIDFLIKECKAKNEDNVLYLYDKGMDFYLENIDGESAYKILKRKISMGQELQALKEKLMLEQDIVCEDELMFNL